MYGYSSNLFIPIQVLCFKACVTSYGSSYNENTITCNEASVTIAYSYTPQAYKLTNINMFNVFI
jgi:hypothetical protein